MRIEEITIENYMCYFGRKSVNLASGLNLILGDNGNGKTKFYEAIAFLLNDLPPSQLSGVVSKKALYETAPEDPIRVGVKVKATQFEETKVVERYFTVQRGQDGSINASDTNLTATVTHAQGRSPANGKLVLDQLFPPNLRKYLMFEGEGALNIFNNTDALTILIDNFSQGKHYRKYTDLGRLLKKKAEKAVDDASRTNKKNELKLSKAKADIELLTSLINPKEEELHALRNNLTQTEEHKAQAEAYVANADALEIVNKRIEDVETKLTTRRSQLKEKYTSYLFDDKWILANFAPFQVKFMEKVEEIEQQKREADRTHQREVGKQQEREKITLQGNRNPLPINVPSVRYVKEMINEHFCKMCNRIVEPDSEAFRFMVQRLEEYEEDIRRTREEANKNKLFTDNYLRRLITLTDTKNDQGNVFAEVKQSIESLFNFNQGRKTDISKLEERLEFEKGERNEIVGRSQIGAERLTTVLSQYTRWTNNINADKSRISVLGESIAKLKSERAERHKEKDRLDNDNVDHFLINAQNLLRDVEEIFTSTEERLYREFVEDLERKTNEILQRINVDSFTGTVVFDLTWFRGDPKIKIRLVTGDDEAFSSNQSLETTMHMAILFAIAMLAKDTKSESFPMIFDAPTSSFGEPKTKEFLNIVSESDQQRIVLFYNFLTKDENGKSVVKSDFANVKRNKAYVLQLKRPFDPQQLRTIDTLIEEI